MRMGAVGAALRSSAGPLRPGETELPALCMNNDVKQ